MDQTRNEAKKSRDSIGWNTVWPVGSLGQTPDEAAAAKAQNLKLSNQAVVNQNKDESKKVEEITKFHSKESDDAAALKLKLANAQDDMRRGGAPPSRDSLGWSLVQQVDNRLGSKGQIPQVKQFLTPDYQYGDNEMSRFAQTASGDYKGNTIGQKG